MPNFWDDWQKPWTKEQCRDRYIRGTRISVPELVELSGCAEGSIRRWASKDPDGTWKEQRDLYLAQQRSQTDLKAIAKTSEKLADEISDIVASHFRGYRVLREISMTRLDFINDCLKHPETAGEQMASLNPLNINYWSLVFDRSVRGERVALGLEYEDLNKAIAAVERAGFEVRVPPNMTFIPDASQIQLNPSQKSQG
jgi:hypothetical protein